LLHFHDQVQLNLLHIQLKLLLYSINGFNGLWINSLKVEHYVGGCIVFHLFVLKLFVVEVFEWDREYVGHCFYQKLVDLFDDGLVGSALQKSLLLKFRMKVDPEIKVVFKNPVPGVQQVLELAPVLHPLLWLAVGNKNAFFGIRGSNCLLFDFRLSLVGILGYQGCQQPIELGLLLNELLNVQLISLKHHFFIISDVDQLGLTGLIFLTLSDTLSDDLMLLHTVVAHQ